MTYSIRKSMDYTSLCDEADDMLPYWVSKHDGIKMMSPVNDVIQRMDINLVLYGLCCCYLHHSSISSGDSIKFLM